MTTFLRSPEYRKQKRTSFLVNKARVRKELEQATAVAGVHEPALQIISPTETTVILPGVTAASTVTTTNVVISAGGGTPTVFEEDFSTYTDSANWRTDPNNWYDTIPTPSAQFIDTSITDPEITTSSQSLRIEYLPGVCGGIAVGFNIRKWQDGRVIEDISPDVTELWIEMRVRFDSAWNTNDAHSCSEVENHQLLRAHVGEQGQEPFFQLNDGAGPNSYWNIGAPPDDIGQSQGEDSDDSLPNSDNTWNVVRCNFKLSEVTKTIPDGRAFFELNGKRLIGRNTGFDGEDIITATTDPLGTGETYNNFVKIQFLGELKPLKTSPTQKLWVSRVRVYDQDPGWPTSFQNEPANFNVLTERPFTTYNEDGWGNNGIGNYLVPHIDASAPISPDNVGRAKFAAGRTGGTGPISTFRGFTATDTLYVAFPFKMSANWQGHSSGVNKIFFITASDYGSGAAEPVYLAAFGQDNNTLNFQIRLQGPGNETSQGSGQNLGGNLASAALTRDVWYKIEIQLIANTGTNFDGELHVWIDNTKTHRYTDVKFFDDAADLSNHKFTGIKWNPTWGGTGDTVIETMYQFVDHIRVSGP